MDPHLEMHSVNVCFKARPKQCVQSTSYQPRENGNLELNSQSNSSLLYNEYLIENKMNKMLCGNIISNCYNHSYMFLGVKEILYGLEMLQIGIDVINGNLFFMLTNTILDMLCEQIVMKSNHFGHKYIFQAN